MPIVSICLQISSYNYRKLFRASQQHIMIEELLIPHIQIFDEKKKSSRAVVDTPANLGSHTGSSLQELPKDREALPQFDLKHRYIMNSNMTMMMSRVIGEQATGTCKSLRNYRSFSLTMMECVKRGRNSFVGQAHGCDHYERFFNSF